MSFNQITYKNLTFIDKDLKSGNCLLAFSPESDSLAADALEFDIRSEDTSLTAYTVGEPVVYSYKGERVGTFYIQSVERIGQYTYHFATLSAVGLLMSKTHYGGMYSGQDAKSVILDICSGTGVEVIVKTAYQDMAIYGWLPVATARDNLSQVLFAIGASLKTDANGALRVTSLYAGPSWVRGPDKCFLGGSVTYGTPVSRVIVTEHKFELGTERVTLFEGAASYGDVIRFDEPSHDLQASGFTILESNCNYAKVSAGTGMLTGIKYDHNMRDITRGIAGQESGKDVAVKEAYLVSLANSAAVSERLVEYYSHTEQISQDAVWTGERAGDIVRTEHPYSGTEDIFLPSVNIAMSGLLRAGEEGVVGYKPLPPEGQTYYNQSAVLTGSGIWTVPDDINQIRVVLIGGGRGGPGGSPGGVGRQGGSSTGTNSWGETVYRKHAGSAGEGGAGAPSGGEGGNIFEFDLDVKPGQSFSYSCGSGGTGGSNEANGSLGTNTTFGTYTSASGAPRTAGYSEVMSGQIYARKSTIPGIAGGRGTGSTDPSDYNAPVQLGNTISYSGGSWGPGSTGSGAGYAGGGFGGGAAAGKAGGTGGAATTSKTGNGGTGATPTAPAAATTIGEGGAGGHGGGGGGGNGYSVSPSSNIAAGSPGSGGAGGRGGTGGPGGIIIYYAIKQEIHSGRFLARGSTPFFAQTKRIFAV